MAGGSVQRDVHHFMPQFTVHETDSLNAHASSEVSADALPLTNYETFFLIQPHKYPIMHVLG